MIMYNNFLKIIESCQKDTSSLPPSDPILVTEATVKKYKCPYCEERLARDKLSSHIEKKHSEMISDEFSANRIAFNTINKKLTGRCVQCGNETKWNEDNIRYDRFCSMKCKDAYVKIAKSRMVNKYGKEYLLDDPDHQNKMLSNRRISGTYTSSKGEVFTYVGSYEKKLLEFEDIVLGLTALDIVTPGPTIKYKFKGENHFWITDQYIAPFNLVIDVKDGGDNPNNREMPEYRAKQDAKEKAIKDLGTYNYIRLTDNKFEQLLSVMMAIKYSMIDNPKDYKPIIRINESASINIDSILEYNTTTANAIPDTNTVYVVPYLKNAVFAGTDINSGEDPTIDYAISFSNYGEDFITYTNGSFYSIPAKKLKDYKMYSYNREMTTKIDTNFTPSNILEAIIGSKVYSPSRLEYDPKFTLVESFLSTIDSVVSIVESTVTNIDNDGLKIPVVEFNLKYDDIQAYYEDDGIYLENSSGIRTKKYDSIKDIDQQTINILRSI